MTKFINRVKLIGKECLNLLTNLICPLISVVMIVLEAFGTSAKTLEKVKKLEYAAFQISGTLEDVKTE